MTQRPRTFTSADEVRAAVGEDLGVSEWVTVTQKHVDFFADAAGDRQWIRIDVDRAEVESPFGGTIAHGYLSLSLLPSLASQIYAMLGAKLVVNYVSNKVRFVTPVLVGAKVRLRLTFLSADEVRGGAVQLTISNTLEVSGVQQAGENRGPSHKYCSDKIEALIVSTPPSSRRIRTTSRSVTPRPRPQIDEHPHRRNEP